MTANAGAAARRTTLDGLIAQTVDYAGARRSVFWQTDCRRGRRAGDAGRFDYLSLSQRATRLARFLVEKGSKKAIASDSLRKTASSTRSAAGLRQVGRYHFFALQLPDAPA